jgi:hypothetical protein
MPLNLADLAKEADRIAVEADISFQDEIILKNKGIKITTTSLSLLVEQQMQPLQMLLVQSDSQTLIVPYTGDSICIISLTSCNMVSQFSPPSKKRSRLRVKSL